MGNRKKVVKKLVAVRIDNHLDRAVEQICKRDGIMKKDFFALALQYRVEVSNDAA